MPRPKTALDRTSSLHKYFICNTCDKKLYGKKRLINHDCINNRIKVITCRWCNVTFKSKGCLANHAKNVHGDMSYSKVSKKRSSEIVKCNVCSKMFAELFQLRYHIRRQHFNLKSRLPYWFQKKVNQVWFEKVLNCNNVMEIRKAGPNTLVMRKLAENTAIKVADPHTEEIDVSDLYPTGPKYDAVVCKICSKRFGKRNLHKHMQEVHQNQRLHHCNKCKLQFKRLYLFLRHVCGKKRKPRTVRPRTSVELTNR